MNNESLSAQQNLLREKKCERLWMCWPLLLLIPSFMLFLYSARHVSEILRSHLGWPLFHFGNSIALLICSLIYFPIFLMMIRWMTHRIEPINTEIKNLQCEIEELILACKKEEISAKIRSSKIKPDPNSQ